MIMSHSSNSINNPPFSKGLARCLMRAAISVLEVLEAILRVPPEASDEESYGIA